MMELTRKGEYAVRGIIYLARLPYGNVALLSDIAEAAHIPQTFLAKIFQNFAKLGFVNSYRGTGGGFSLARPASAITLREVVEAVEGPIAPNRCVNTPGECERSAICPVHTVWRRVQLQAVEILDGVTIEELALASTE
jgi:Rrf2 family transcriptional regulator, iron-sulfur cluster assembly transcription factor